VATALIRQMVHATCCKSESSRLPTSASRTPIPPSITTTLRSNKYSTPASAPQVRREQLTVLDRATGHEELHVGIHAIGHTDGLMPERASCHRQPPVLVDAVELVNLPQRVKPKPVGMGCGHPSVRLLALDDIANARGDTCKLPLGFRTEVGLCPVADDREHELFLDLWRKLPTGVLVSGVEDRVIQSGAEVVDGVADDQRQLVGRCLPESVSVSESVSSSVWRPTTARSVVWAIWLMAAEAFSIATTERMASATR
jgi:hypothetical protein